MASVIPEGADTDGRVLVRSGDVYKYPADYEVLFRDLLGAEEWLPATSVVIPDLAPAGLVLVARRCEQ